LERRLEQIGGESEKQNLGAEELSAQNKDSVLEEPKEVASTVTVADSFSMSSEKNEEELNQGNAKKKHRSL
jgi:hypothetical protein